MFVDDGLAEYVTAFAVEVPQYYATAAAVVKFECSWTEFVAGDVVVGVTSTGVFPGTVSVVELVLAQEVPNLLHLH